MFIGASRAHFLAFNIIETRHKVMIISTMDIATSMNSYTRVCLNGWAIMTTAVNASKHFSLNHLDVVLSHSIRCFRYGNISLPHDSSLSNQ
jgi:hypothetical protein